MEITIDNELKELIPDFKIGFIEYERITVGESPQMVKGRLQLFQENLYFELEGKKVTDLSGIAEWRSIFKKTGKDPNRYRHSAEALVRRVQKQNYLQPVNSSTDLNNFFSLQYEIPIGIYDYDLLKGPLIVRIGQEDEMYDGLNGRSNSLHNLIISADKNGPFGSPFVDSVKTCVTEQTTNAIQIIYLAPSLETDQAKQMVSSLADMFTNIHGGMANWKIVD